ncbi:MULTISPECIES: DUF6944 family repetitive protein [Bacillaceae]|uniref:Uncharacterized protein n=1 Tax=Evansella alkalicola TaxID=745819 RepID=A0ABS6JWT4_9BACI|nr:MULTISPECIES: hypothetical protein [Bacillaceae]MBU9723050.1 hypothetical protein [Bacillus alkalicola]
MSDQLLDLTGNWIESIGATIAAVGETQQLYSQKVEGFKLGVVGNSVQGVGNAFQAIAETDDGYVELGNWLQAAGTSSNSIAEYRMLYDLGNKFDNNLMEINGDVLQAIGAFYASIGRIEQNPKLVYGNLLQSLGAIVEAIGVIHTINSDEVTGQKMETVGGWLQSIGTMYQAIGATRLYLNGMSPDGNNSASEDGVGTDENEQETAVDT